jgi:hypothetical protein
MPKTKLTEEQKNDFRKASNRVSLESLHCEGQTECPSGRLDRAHVVVHPSAWVSVAVRDAQSVPTSRQGPSRQALGNAPPHGVITFGDK